MGSVTVFFSRQTSTFIQKLKCLFKNYYYFISLDNHDFSDRKITSSKLAEMFVSLLLQAEGRLNTSQVPGQQAILQGCHAGN